MITRYQAEKTLRELEKVGGRATLDPSQDGFLILYNTFEDNRDNIRAALQSVIDAEDRQDTIGMWIGLGALLGFVIGWNARRALQE